MKFITRDTETGTMIDEFNTYEEAANAIANYEEEDKADGAYEEGFYEIAELA